MGFGIEYCPERGDICIYQVEGVFTAALNVPIGVESVANVTWVVIEPDKQTDVGRIVLTGE